VDTSREQDREPYRVEKTTWRAIMKFKFAQAFVMGLCLYSATAGAVPWDKPTDNEIAVLPPYCLAKFRGVAVEQWQNTLGSIYLHVPLLRGAGRNQPLL
jgi:hypothetical protein